MGFKGRVKKVFSTGQASAVDEARRLHKGGDIAGAIARLKQALDARTESGKALGVIRELHEAYSDELNLKQLRGYRAALSEAAFDLANYDRIDGIMTSLNRALMENVYSGKARPEAEALYKKFHEPFQKIQLDVHQNRQSEILKKLEITDLEKSADEFVTLVEELRRIGGRLPQTMDSDYRVAQERSYILPDNLQEFDNYIIERKLGRGGFASVFLASPKGVSFQAAIKIFSPEPTLVRESGLSLAELKERFRREAGIMLRLSTERIPGIVNARDTKTWRGKPYLTMDYYPKNLSSLIGSDEELLQTGRGGYLSYDKAFPLISRILTSIHGLHNRTEPIIHRDLKPANILLDKDNRPYIADFGLAREASRADLLSKAFETVTGTHLATQYYGAPEQRGGFKETDHRADVFSLGVIIYRILTGRLIGFHDLEPIELYVQGLGKDTAGKINDLLNKATRIEVAQRLADVSTLLEIFSPDQAAVEVSYAPRSGPTAEDQFLTALEWAYSFAPDGKLPENVRAKLVTKPQELGIDLGEAELLEKDFRSRLGLSEDKSDRVISATGGAALKTGEEKGFGTLIITSEPEMAIVSVDGIERGTTPLTIDRVGAGKRTIRLKMNGFFPVSRIERIDPEKETKIHVILEHQTGTINVNAKTFSDAYPARFYLDGKLMGRPPLTVEDVTAGTHTYRLEADKHQEATGEVTVTLDEGSKISEILEPLPGRISLKSNPSGAAIWLDGNDSGKKTDGELKLKSGGHRVTLKLPGYLDVERELDVAPGVALEEPLNLVRNIARLSVASVPEGAAIWLDGQNTEQKTDSVLEVIPGKHTIVLRRYGYRETAKVVDLAPEKFLEVELRLEKGEPAVASTAGATEPDVRYVAGGEGIVRDTKTGLEWFAGPDKRVTWNEAKSWANRLKRGGGGWRVPTIDELKSLYEKGLGSRNMTPLLKTTGWYVWSDETGGSPLPWPFTFYDGTRAWHARGFSYSTRAFAVRGRVKEVELRLEKGEPAVVSTSDEADPNVRHVAAGNGIVKDTGTGLEWVAGPDKDTTWEEAKSWVDGLKIDGGGWRMPTTAEMKSLYEKGLGSRNMTPLLKTTGWFVWSGKTKGLSRAWNFDFYDGHRCWYGRNGSVGGRAFAVRSQKRWVDHLKF